MNSMAKSGSRIVFKLLVIATIFMGTIVPTNVANAGAIFPSNIPALGLFLEENIDIAASADVAITMSDPGGELNDAYQSKSLICSSMEDKICDEAVLVKITQHLPVCAVDPSIACISEVWAIDSSGKKTDGNYVTSLPAKWAYDRDPIPSMDLPAVRGSGALWNIPGVTNSGGEDNYFVSVMNVSYVAKAAGISLLTKKAEFANISAAITPVQKVSGNYRPNKAFDKRDGGPGFTAYGEVSTPTKERCAVTDTGICEVARDYPKGYRFGLNIKVGSKLSGWFHGRIALPIIATKPWKNGVEISVEAEPVKISTLDFTVPNSQIPEAVRKIVFVDKPFGNNGSIGDGKIYMGDNAFSLNMELMNAFLPAIGDKANKTKSYWSYKALNSWNQPAIQKCSDGTGELAGVVTTNALTYSSGPPIFDQDSGSLIYKVASPHFEANGDVARGSYDLVLRADVARCIYGFSKAPIRAEISITSSDGSTQEIASEMLSEKDGWFYLSAKNFTFSSPTLKVKLTQEKPKEVVVETKVESAKPVEAAVAAVKPATPKKSLSILCSKGKITKKITGANPKCPSGFRKR